MLAETAERAPEGVPRGGYVLVDEEGGAAEIVLVSTGSEVHVCVAAAGAAGRPGRAGPGGLAALLGVVRDPGPRRTARSVLPPGVPHLSVEAAASFGWDRYADASVAIDTFGASAPGEVALAEFGFTPENVAERAILLALVATPGTASASASPRPPPKRRAMTRLHDLYEKGARARGSTTCAATG